MHWNEIVQRYKAGDGTTELARLSGMHRTTIQRRLKKAGVVLRHHSFRPSYQTEFFARCNPTSVYWAGFTLADGCVRSDRATVSWHLALKDVEHLHTLAATLGLPASRVRRYARSCRLDVSGPWFPRDLMEHFGVTPRKSLVARFPVQLHKKHWRHLVRGIFDGDGSVRRLGKNQMTMLNFAGSKQLLTELREIFFGLGVRLKSRNRVPPVCMTSRAGLLAYSGRNADMILRWMYEGSSTSTRLGRKYERWRAGPVIR